MKKIFKPSQLHSFLKNQNRHARKGLSQNFLIDGNIVQKIVHMASIKKEDVVLEIGPGPGALTEAMLEKGADVTAIELDEEFAQELHRLQTQDHRLKVICQDVLQFPFSDFLHRFSKKCKVRPLQKSACLEKTDRFDEISITSEPAYAGRLIEGKRESKDREKDGFNRHDHLCNGLKVVANLPYHITTPILTLLLPMHQWIHSLTIMVQKEFGDRMAAKKKTPEYSSFTLFFQFYAKLIKRFDVSPHCFFPKPKVYSSVLHCELHPPLLENKSDGFFKLTRTAFGKRRKMLRSSLKEIYEVQKIESALEKLGYSTRSRPEELSIDEFISFFELLDGSS